MGIPRSTWQDDDGTGASGSVVNNAELQKIYDNIDLYFGTPRVTLSKVTTEQAVTNSAALTSVFSFSVPANILATSGILAFSMTGECTNTSGGASTLIINAQYGGVNLTAAASVFSIPAGATHEGLTLEIILAANANTQQQRSVARLHALTAGALADAGWSAAGNIYLAAHSSLAVDSTVAQTFQVSIQHGTAASTITFKRWSALLELIRP